MKKLTFIDELLAQKENISLECFREYQLQEILKTVCSFLNTDGGWILIGHPGKAPIGIDPLIDVIVDELKMNILDRIFPQSLIDVRAESYDGKNVILINVIKGSRQPYSFDRKYYIRLSNKTKEASQDEISQLLRTSNEFLSSWEKLSTVDAALDDLSQNEIEKTILELEKLGRGKQLPNQVADFLSYFQLFDFNRVRNGAIVLFGISPARFFSQCRIRVTKMPFGKTGSRYDDSLLIEDNLFIAFKRIQEYFKLNLPLVSEFKHDDWDRKTRQQYPLDAMDEAVLNAMIHRDYADISGEIVINIYHDKIEIINSGEIPANIIKNKNQIIEHHSVLRNPTIAHIFYLRGKIEKVGRGLDLIKDRFTDLDLKEPEWIIQGGYTTLTLFGTSKEIDFNERMFKFLKTLRIEHKFGREEYQNFFKGTISEKTARNDISKLVEGGWIKKIGVGPSTKYARTNKEFLGITG